MNPYWDQNFFGFFHVLFHRLVEGCPLPLASDEVQMLVLVSLALPAACLGTFLILRRMTMLANALSHTILIGIVLAFLLSSWLKGTHDLFHLDIRALLLGAGVSALLTSLSVYGLKKVTVLSPDARIGIPFSLFFAAGVLCVTSLLKNTHIGIEAIMGNIDATHPNDLPLLFGIGGAVLLFIFFTFPYLKLFAFDATYAASLSLRTALIDQILLFLLALLSLCAFRVIGVFLFLAMLTLPPLAFLGRVKSIGSALWKSGLFAFFISILSVAVSRHILSVWHLPLSTAGLFVLIASTGLVLTRRPSFATLDSAS